MARKLPTLAAGTVLSLWEWPLGKNSIITARVWRRFSEKPIEDDNPRKNVFTLTVRNNLNFNHNRGHAELSWIYPLSRDLRIMLQASHGYGDSLIDYNYKQTVLGVGFTFLNL